MAMGACPGQIPMSCVPPALMVTATMVRACRYILFNNLFNFGINSCVSMKIRNNQ